MHFLRFSWTQSLLAVAVLCFGWRAQAAQSAVTPVFPTVELKVAGDKAGANAKAAPADAAVSPDMVKPAEATNPPNQAAPDPAKTVVDKTTSASWKTMSAEDAPPSGAPEKAKSLAPESSDGQGETYILGPQDTLRVRVIDMDEMGTEPFPIDLRGNVMLPRLGRVHAAGKTADQMEAELTTRYREYLQEPVVSVSVVEFHSQPISILGAVESPGVHQIKGSKSLFEVISEAGGLRDDAGNTITITRKLENGKLPLANAAIDASGKFSVADLNIRSVMSARNPGQNIGVKPYDVITVPKADLIYVIGSVKRPGGFPLQERANMTVLEALALAEGLDRTASGGRAKILRTDENTHSRTEIPVDVKKIMQGKLTDTALLANDILFIPTSTGKAASYRALEALVTTGTGIAIYRP